MSALARYFKAKNVDVMGYDKTNTILTQQLIKEKIPVHFKENINIIPENIDLVIYTPAIPKTNKEYKYFLKNKYDIKKRSEVLGMLTQKMFTVAIAGTHGKTSITALIAHILKQCDIKVTAFIGGITKNYNSNLVLSQNSDVIVVEADEYDKSFLTLHPDIAVITYMDPDHLDIYGSKKYMQQSFLLFAKQIKNKGKLIINKNLNISDKLNVKKITYSYNTKSDFWASNIRVNNLTNENIFDLNRENDTVKNIKFKVLGKHNIENAVAALSVALSMNLDKTKIKKAIETYTGVERRFDFIINTEKIVYIDDYAHHPAELKACILAVKKLYPNKKITAVFQPHLYSRTRDFADEFAQNLNMLDKLFLLEIYAARELPITGINSKMLLDKIKIKNKCLCKKTELLNKLKKQNIEVLLTLGAGDIDQLIKPIKQLLINKLKIYTGKL